MSTAFLVAFDGIFQDPNDYTITSGTPYTITLSTAPASGVVIVIVSLNGIQGSTGASGSAGGATGATGVTPANIVLSDTTGLTGATQLTNLVEITLTGYNLIVTPDPNTLYVIVGP